MNVLVALGAVIALVLIAYVGAGSVGLGVVFGVVIPYAALATFLIGVVYRVYQWATIPVPFAIATTAGQQDSSEALPFVKPSRLENPPGVDIIQGADAGPGQQGQDVSPQVFRPS